MAADFWAGYLSGAVGIIVGNPLDVLKVRLQANGSQAAIKTFRQTPSLLTGTAAPIAGYGALNALLFVSYNRTEAALTRVLSTGPNLGTAWVAGAVGGLATWVVSAPTELIKCRAQLANPRVSSWEVTKTVWRADGLRGLYFGGLVTALRDSIGYGFYFWSYELANRCWPMSSQTTNIDLRHEAPKVLMCGGIAGIVTWASVFPLDVIKTRVQTQPWNPRRETATLLPSSGGTKLGALQVAEQAYRKGGVEVFFRGLTVCSIRAFAVNASQWAVYEWMMHELGHGRDRRQAQTIETMP